MAHQQWMLLVLGRSAVERPHWMQEPVQTEARSTRMLLLMQHCSTWVTLEGSVGAWSRGFGRAAARSPGWGC